MCCVIASLISGTKPLEQSRNQENLLAENADAKQTMILSTMQTEKTLSNNEHNNIAG